LNTNICFCFVFISLLIMFLPWWLLMIIEAFRYIYFFCWSSRIEVTNSWICRYGICSKGINDFMMMTISNLLVPVPYWHTSQGARLIIINYFFFTIIIIIFCFWWKCLTGKIGIYYSEKVLTSPHHHHHHLYRILHCR